MKDLYDSQTYDLKTRVDIWTRMDIVPVDNGTFAQTFNLKMWFFQFITGINFKWDYVFECSVDLLVLIDLWIKRRFIEFLQNQSGGLAEVLDFYCKKSC